MRTGLKALEFTMNRYVQLDPDSIARLQRLSGKIISIYISDWRLSLLILPNEKGLELSDDPHLVPDVTLRATLFDLIKVGVAKGSNASLFSNKVEIKGDIELGEKIREILEKIDIDWEEHLSHIIGDIGAHQINRSFNKIKKIGKRILSSFSENLSDYLQVESSLLPTETQVEKLFKDIGHLRNDVDRLELRVARLENRKNKKA